MKKKIFFGVIIFLGLFIILTHTCFAEERFIYENGEIKQAPEELVHVYYDKNGNEYLNITCLLVKIFQIAAFATSILMVIIHTCNRISAYLKFKAIKEREKDLEEHSEEYLKIEELYNKRKSHTFGIVIGALFIFAGAGILNIHKSFKPIIYLYPTEETEVRVELGNRELLTTSYPKYEDNWYVLAKPNGDLVDLKTGRNLYALYWEGNKKQVNTSFDRGWCVKGEDSSRFLEEKLAELGLNEREAEEFIVYWLPQLEQNKYNLIKFETQEEIDYNMPLNITPTPDTVIRIMMNYKSINYYVEIEPQELVTPERVGFTVVEWGGSVID